MSNPIPNPLAPRRRELSGDEVQADAVYAVRSDLEGALASLQSAVQDYEAVYASFGDDPTFDEVYGSLCEYVSEIKKIIARYPQKKKRAAA